MACVVDSEGEHWEYTALFIKAKTCGKSLCVLCLCVLCRVCVVHACVLTGGHYELRLCISSISNLSIPAVRYIDSVLGLL